MSTTLTQKTPVNRSEWFDEAVRRLGDNQNHWEFICPACGFVQSVDTFRGLTDLADDQIEKYIGFSCVGRWLKEGEPREAFGRGLGPCNYAGGGLIGLNRIAVEHEGKVTPVFAFAAAEEGVER